MRLFILLGLIGLSFLVSSTVSAAPSCYNAFQASSSKQERTIVTLLKVCKIKTRDAFASANAYAEHLEALYYFIDVIDKYGFSTETNKKLKKLLNKVNKLHLCYKGHKEECPVKKKKKKLSLNELEGKMERACEIDNESFACKFYYRTILLRIERWDFK